MFAAATTDALSVADPAVLKKAPSSIPSCLDLIETPTSSSWTPDNSYLYIASAHTIHRYDPASNVLREVFTDNSTGNIGYLVAKDTFTVVFSAGNKVHVLECEHSPAISQTFESHKTDINSLSLSNDNALLASTSSGAVHVHNLSLGSHAVLRGFANQEINTSIFHPHSRTRLLVAVGKQLMVCDTTRPSSPLKTISIPELTSGRVVDVACSPFSKTLVAVATSGGSIGLIDLEKDKSLVRALNLKVPVTTIGFSPEGAAMYIGTETGKILLVDLRALDKPPKSVTLSETGSSVQTISIQKRIKDGPTKTPLGPSATAGRKAPADVPLPARRTTSNTTSKTVPSPARPKPSVGTSPMNRRAQPPSGSPTTRVSTANPKKVLSPLRDPLGNSGELAGQIDNLANLRRGKPATTPTKVARKPSRDTLRSRPSPSPRKSTTVSSNDRVSSRSKDPVTTTENENPRRVRTLPSSTTTTTATPAAQRKASARAGIAVSTSAGEYLGVPRTSPQRRPRAVSSASRTGTETLSAVSGSSKHATKQAEARPSISTAASNSRLSPSRVSHTNTNTRSATPRDPSASPVRSRLGAMSSASLVRESRTPSPDLPAMRIDPVTPIAAHKQRSKKLSGMNVLGLGTPEVERWVQAGNQDGEDKGKGKGKMVGFQDEATEEDTDNEDHAAETDNLRLKATERDRVLSMQISPRRPMPRSTSGSSTDSWTSPAVASALNNEASPTPGGSSAHDLLRTIVQDVMFDFQRETKAEMVGLHLDLLRMGRGWKTELRTLMDEYVGDLRDLREENQRLRSENERLRRGVY